jgi:hypothetical protein
MLLLLLLLLLCLLTLRGLTTSLTITHLMQQRVVQALHQVRVRNVTSQELGLLNAEVLQRTRAQPARGQLLLSIRKVDVDALAALLGTIPAAAAAAAAVVKSSSSCEGERGLAHAREPCRVTMAPCMQHMG